MPAFETRDLYQKAVLWQASGSRDRYTRVKVTAPVQIDVRWNDKQSLVMDKDGNTVAVDATAIVYVNVSIDSILWLIPDLDTFELDPTFQPTSGLMQVKVDNSTPDIKNRGRRQDLGMIRYSEVFPEVVS
jgi:hypothetical protein